MTQELTHDPKLTSVRKVRGAQSWHTVIHTSAVVTETPNIEATNWKIYSFWPVPQLTHENAFVTIKESYGLNQSKHALFPLQPYNITCF